MIAKRVVGYDLIEASDPTGNNNPAVEIVYNKADGTTITSGAFLYLNAGNGAVIFVRAADAGAAAFFQLNPVNGHVLVQQA
jgi:hypothetical protein